MTIESGGGGSSKKHRPRQDRRRTKKLTRQVRSGGVVTKKQLRNLNDILRNSAAEGTLNTRDRIAVGNLLKHLDTKTNPSGNRSGSIVGGPIMQNSDITRSKAYNNLGQYQVVGGRAGQKAQTNRDGKSVDTTKKKSGGLGTIIGEAVKSIQKQQGKPHPGKSGQGRVTGNKRGGKKRGGGSAPWTQGGMQYYGMGTPPEVPRSEARLLVQQENNNLIKDLLDQAQGYRQDLRFDVNRANSLFDRTQGDLNYIFGEANDYIGNRNKAINQRYENTDTAIGKIFAGLQDTLQQTSNTNRDAAMAEMERLGIQQSGMGSFDQDSNFAQLQAAQQGANAAANLATQQAGANEIGKLLASMSQASLASAVGRATNSRQDAITDAQQGYRQNVNDIRGDITDIQRQTPQTVNELWEAMKNNSFQQFMEMQNADFQNQLAANSFNLDVSKLNSDNFWKQREHAAQVAEARKKRQIARQQMEAERISRQLADAASQIYRDIF